MFTVSEWIPNSGHLLFWHAAARCALLPKRIGLSLYPGRMSVITYSARYLRGFWVRAEPLRFT